MICSSDRMGRYLVAAEGPVSVHSEKEGAGTAICDKVASSNDVCPRGQVMSALLNDIAFGNDAVPLAQWANITSLQPSGQHHYE